MNMAENIHCSLKTGGRRLLFCLLFCALLISGAAGAARAETYGENAFGFVDAVMDSRDGIPEDAEGRLARIREVGAGPNPGGRRASGGDRALFCAPGVH